ncbi:MAG TPA: hypothetical protein VNZ01_14430 [Solirubrobacteraceae bacterium]|nr:hypothetical protein [Solirubrobacteraceae bacterium]
MALALVFAGAGTTADAGATPASRSPPPGAADSPRTRPTQGAGVARAPNSPPLIAGSSSTLEAGADRAAPGSPQVEADPLVSNGLGSPSCTGAVGEGALSPARRRDCQTSGFSAAGAPTENYGIDVHIDTGLLGVSSGGLLSVVQDVFVTPLWMALVWSVHALVVMLEWCFAIDLLDSPATGAVGRGLRQMQASFTDPWLAAVLAVAAVLALYNGLIRRRVAETLGQAVAMGAMMAGGMWLIADPTGTVGALGGWANQASMGTLAVSARGTPSRSGQALTDGMAALFSSAIEAPWCYLEFGDVRWCRDPSRLDPRLHQSALKIAAAELAVIGCRSPSLPVCVPRGSTEAGALERGATLLREANTNGAIFLALPANGPARNSINQQDSLLRTICQSSEATHCTGPTAAQAQFRTNGGTWSRVGGLLLILAGVLGMLLLFGYIGLRLLGAAIFSLLYLLLAPAVILAPALGEAGRVVFRRWAAHLLAAVVSKLLFSLLLGVVLAVLSILASLEGLGWWTQWLLMSAFWWGAYARRHQALAVAEGAFGRERGREHRVTRRRRRLETPYVVRRVAGHARERFSEARAELRARERPEPTGGQAVREATDAQARRMLESERRFSGMRMQGAREAELRLSAARSRLVRLRDERERALAVGDTRRAAELACRAERLEREVVEDQHEIDTARRVVDGEQASSRKDSVVAREQADERTAFLDAQARLSGGRRSGGASSSERRDYARLAYLVGLGRERYQRLAAPEQRMARLEIDRELALRRDMRHPLGDPSAGGSRPPLRGRHALGPDADRGAGRSHAGTAGSRGRGSAEEGSAESSVMRDAREVAARRKRQLGLNRP